MNSNNENKHQQHQDSESGQALVISAGILFVLAITFILFMNVQRAYSLANYLDETAELAAQSAAEPVANDLVNGDVQIDSSAAVEKAEATVELLASLAPEIKNDVIRTTDSSSRLSTIKITDIQVINPGLTTNVNDPLCEEFNNSTPGDDLCVFPLVAVYLTLPHKLFGIEFDINTRGVATLGANSRQPEAVPVTLPVPTALPPAAPIVIPVNPP